MLSGHNFFISNEFIGTMWDIDTENKYVSTHIFDGNCVFNKSHNITKLQWKSISCIVRSDNTTHNILNKIREVPDIKETINDDKVFCLTCFGESTSNHRVITYFFNYATSIIIPSLTHFTSSLFI